MSFTSKDAASVSMVATDLAGFGAGGGLVFDWVRDHDGALELKELAASIGGGLAGLIFAHYLFFLVILPNVFPSVKRELDRMR